MRRIKLLIVGVAFSVLVALIVFSGAQLAMANLLSSLSHQPPAPTGSVTPSPPKPS